MPPASISRGVRPTFRSSSGGRLNLKSGSTVAGERVIYKDGSFGAVVNSHFSYSKPRAVQFGRDGGQRDVHAGGSGVDEIVARSRTVQQHIQPGATVSVDGPVSTNLTWKVNGKLSRYRVNGIVTINVGTTLTIEPGVTVRTDSSRVKRHLGPWDLGCHRRIFHGKPHGHPGQEWWTIESEDGSKVAGHQVVYESGSSGSASCTTFVIPVSLHAGSTFVATNNDFSLATLTATGPPATTIDLRDQYWGENANPALIENKIIHQVDNPQRPLVLFEPFQSSRPTACTPQRSRISPIRGLIAVPPRVPSPSQ